MRDLPPLTRSVASHIQSKEISTNTSLTPYVTEEISIKSGGASSGVIRDADAAVEEHKPAGYVDAARLHGLECAAHYIARKRLPAAGRIGGSDAVGPVSARAEIVAALYPGQIHSEQPSCIAIDVYAAFSRQVGHK